MKTVTQTLTQEGCFSPRNVFTCYLIPTKSSEILGGHGECAERLLWRPAGFAVLAGRDPGLLEGSYRPTARTVSTPTHVSYSAELRIAPTLPD